MSFLTTPARNGEETLDLATSSVAVEFRLRTVHLFIVGEVRDRPVHEPNGAGHQQHQHLKQERVGCKNQDERTASRDGECVETILLEISQ